MKQIYPSTHTFSRYLLSGSLAAILSISYGQVAGQSCPSNGRTTISSYVNTFYPGTSASLSPTNTSMTLGAAGYGTDSIHTGDVLLIIQMQGAQINNANSSSYGSGAGTGTGNLNTSLMAGNMEYVVAANAVPPTGGTLNLQSGLIHAYQNSVYTSTSGQYRYQLVRVPIYANLKLNGTITAPAWNGTSGGVLVLYALDSIIMNGQTVSASGAGFRGGGGRKLGGAGGTSAKNTDYLTTTSWLCNGSKGEGIAGTPRYINNNGVLLDNGSTLEGYPGGSYGRGAPGNAGGGGTDGNPKSANDQNTGGAGGANGGSGGGGGLSWSTSVASGGIGGSVFNSTASSVVMGGGGGSGTTNDGTGTPSNGLASSGSAGGGIVILYATYITGTGTVDVSGAFGNSTVQNDGAGGGGAGGSAIIFSYFGNITNITVNANGGNGGSNETGGGASHGPGGGGGGGVFYSNAPLNAASTANGGLNGTTSGNTTNYGAVNGTTGVTVQNANISQIAFFPLVCSILSMNFVSITAEPQSGSVSVDWTVANEVNASAYVIEKSLDGKNYTAIGTVDFKPGSSNVNHYHYTDENAISPTGSIYYRIKEVDFSGGFNYSWIVSVSAGEPASKLSVYPNPASQSATVSFVSAAQGAISLKLVDLKGSLLWKTEYQANAGVNTVQLASIGSLPDGIYFLQYFDGAKPGTVKLLVRH